MGRYSAIKIEYIIRYSGTIADITDEIEFEYIMLLGNFAVIYIEEDKVSALFSLNSILYAEPSRRVFYENISNAYGASCMRVPSTGGYDGIINGDFPFTDFMPAASDTLTGRGVVVAVIDSGVDLTHRIFGGTEVIEVWDQTADGGEVPEYGFGSITSDHTDTDTTGHGTSVAGIIAQCAPESLLLVVKLRGDTENSSSTASLICAIDYCIRKSIELRLPMVINLSYGNNYGDHAGHSILEHYMDENAEASKLTMVVGMGNDGDTKRHAQLMFGNTAWEKRDIIVNPFLREYSIQIWKNAEDMIDAFIRPPGVNELGPFNESMTNYSNIVNGNLINAAFRKQTPYNPFQEIFINISGTRGYVSQGIWTVLFRPRSIRNGRVDLYLPVRAATSADVYFSNPSPFTTMTIPATADNIISVGAYNHRTLSYADFSGRGYSRNGQVKPDIAAPGVDINAPIPGGSYQNKSGTSFATPFVSAGAALLMQWGIIDGNDPFLYGAKLRGNIINGAKKLPGYSEYPNEYVGWGALCVRDSIK